MNVIFQFTPEQKLRQEITKISTVTEKTSPKNIVNHQHLSTTELI